LWCNGKRLPAYPQSGEGVTGTKTTKITRFPKDMNKGRPNFKSQIMKQKHNMCKIRFQRKFIPKTRKRTKQGCDKGMYPKLVLNILKVMENFAFIYTHWAPNSKKFLKKLPTYMWLKFTHVHPCVAIVHPCVNYE
jgi:hypothetical protein